MIFVLILFNCNCMEYNQRWLQYCYLLIVQETMEEHQYIGQYKVKAKIGEGSFGQIFEAAKEGLTYAIKTENIGNVKPMVALEFQLFKELEAYRISNQAKLQIQGYGFPKVYQYHQEDHFSYMVMDRLDTTLQDLVNLQLQNQISKDVLLVIMYNTFRCIRALHEIGYLYRDIKPSNFMMKRQEMNSGKGKIYLIDLGLCKKYTKKDSNEHIPLKNNKRMIGTPIFCSVNTHRGIESSRRDDLESWVYMIIYLVKKLPWESHSAQSLPSLSTETEVKQTSSDRIGKLKEAANICQLIREEPKLPKCLIKIFDSIRHLEFETKPDYELIEKWINQEYEKLTVQGNKICDQYFKTQTTIKLQPQPKPAIKISFKAPVSSNKIKKRNLQEININKILES